MKNKLIAKKNLSEDIWGENKILNPIVRKALLKIVLDFINSIDLDIKIKDIVIVGSLTGFFWSKKSDIDVHIIYDPLDNNLDPKIADILFKTLSHKWNLSHEVFIKGHPVELYMQSINEKNISPGVYSLISNRWLIEPKYSDIEFIKPNLEEFKKEVNQWIEDIKTSIKTKNPEIIKNVLSKLKKYRKSGLDKNGEFSVENLVFKYLRNHGWILKLKNAYQKIYNKKVSVEELFEPLSSSGPNTGPIPNGEPYYEYITKKMRGISSGKIDPEINIISKFLRKHINEIFLDDAILLESHVRKKILNNTYEKNNISQSVLKKLHTSIEKQLNLLDGYGALNPDDDILSIPGKRWTIKYKYDAYTKQRQKPSKS